jgi:Fe2+ or Zn2+ uptake regulation protein
MVRQIKLTPKVEGAVDRILLLIQNNPHQNYSYYKHQMLDSTFGAGTATVQKALAYIEQEGLATVEFQKNKKIFSLIITEHSYDQDVNKSKAVWNKELKKLEKEIKNLSNILKTKDFTEKLLVITKIYDEIVQYSFNVFQLHLLTEDDDDLKRFSNLYRDFNHIAINDKEGSVILYSINKLN